MPIDRSQYVITICPMNTFKEVIKQWPNYDALASDLGVSYATVTKWYERQNIPAEYWIALIGAARARRYRGITAQKLAELSVSDSHDE